jgi:hypothetical protein
LIKKEQEGAVEKQGKEERKKEGKHYRGENGDDRS